MAVEEVANLLVPALRGLQDPRKASETVLGVLDAHYPVVFDPGHMGYLVRWCPGIMDFKVVCLETAFLFVLAPDETVVVEVEEFLTM
jgi:hypothetical protein